uniref:uncharacterized protein LOC120429577 n=1 Tax=Culex pipiens pallens TaxID=42434 RepID=UPI0022AADB78|nr:uncharacterized protein LOC120429577 [Culex pipiens pallens]
MGGRTLMLCGFLVVLVAVERCAGSRSDVRQQLRSEVVYSERNHKEGRYKYGYAVKKGESQFHHQRSLDGAMYGCYGYVDPQGKLFITHYLADMAGYRLVNMANPDRKLAERIRNLGTADSPIDLQHLFPAECQEDGDMKTLKETADAMKASLAESGDQSASYRSRSSSHSVSSGSQDSTIRGTSTASQTSQSNSGQQSTSYGSRSSSTTGSSESGYSKTKGSSDLLKSTSNIEVDQVKSNQNQLGFKESFGNDRKVQTSQSVTITKQQSSSQQASDGKSSVDLIKTNVNRGSNQGKTSVGTLTASEPKFVMKSNTKDSSVSFAASDSNRSSTLKKTASGTNVAHETKKSTFLEKAEVTSGSKVASQATGQQTSESQTEINVSGNKLDVTTSSTEARTSVGKSEQKASGSNGAHETKKSPFLEKAEATSGSKVASQINTNVQGQSVKLAAEIPDVANYEEINLRFDDDDASDVEAGVKQSSTSSTSSSKKTDQGAFSGRSSSAVYRGTVKYANYAIGSNQATDQSKTTTATKSAEVQRKVPRGKARVQQQTETRLEQNVAMNLHVRTVAKSRMGAVTVAEYIKDSTSSDASKMQQAESVQQSTDMSTKQEEISVKSIQTFKSDQEYSTNKQNVEVSSDQVVAEDRVMQKESSNVGGLKQGAEQSGTIQTSQKSMSKQEYSTNKQTIDVSTDQSKVQNQIVSKESISATELQDSTKSETVQNQRSSETSSGRSYNQAKAEQSMKQVKESSKDSAPIIRFAIPGIIQQGSPVQGRRSFVGIPNLNGIFPTNSQSRVGTVPVGEDDYPRSEVMRLPATPRPSTPASPDAVSVSYQLPSGTDRTPVTPRPTTVFRPTTAGFPATTVKSLIYRTTVGPSGDIYDEIEEEPELGSRPTLMSPQIPEQKPPIATSGGVTVIPSISQGVLVENTALPHCSDVTLMIPADAKQIFVRTNSQAFRVYGAGDPNERIRLVEPGVYEVNLGATSGIQFNQYRADEGDWKRSNKLQLDMDRSFDYGELVQKPLYSRAQSATTGDGGNQARLNNPYLPLVPAPVEARNAVGSAEPVLTPEQRSLLSLVPSWKKVLLYY